MWIIWKLGRAALRSRPIRACAITLITLLHEHLSDGAQRRNFEPRNRRPRQWDDEPEEQWR